MWAGRCWGPREGLLVGAAQSRDPSPPPRRLPPILLFGSLWTPMPVLGAPLTEPMGLDPALPSTTFSGRSPGLPVATPTASHVGCLLILWLPTLSPPLHPDPEVKADAAPLTARVCRKASLSLKLGKFWKEEEDLAGKDLNSSPGHLFIVRPWASPSLALSLHLAYL